MLIARMIFLDADLVVIPGTRATVDDLAWLHQRGLAQALRDRVRKNRPTIGICGGFQMLSRVIDDPYESGAGIVSGLDLLPVRVRFLRERRWLFRKVERLASTFAVMKSTMGLLMLKGVSLSSMAVGWVQSLEQPGMGF